MQALQSQRVYLMFLEGNISGRHSDHLTGGCLRGSVRHLALYRQKLQIFPFIASSGRAISHAHHNKRIMRRLSRLLIVNNAFREFPLFNRDHIPEGFLLFAFQMLLVFFFVVTL